MSMTMATDLALTGISASSAIPVMSRVSTCRSSRTSHSSGDSDGGGSPAIDTTTTIAPNIISTATTSTPPPSPSPRLEGSSSSSSSARHRHVMMVETPSRKNKRKLSEPRKRGNNGEGVGGCRGRGELNVQRLCRVGSPGGSAMSESGCSDDAIEECGGGGGGGGGDGGYKPRSVGMRQRLSREEEYEDEGAEEDSSSSRGPSEGGNLTPPVPGCSQDLLSHPNHHALLPHPHQHGHHPVFPAAGLGPCFMPGFYLADGRSGFPPPHPTSPFPHLPLPIRHPMFASGSTESPLSNPRPDSGSRHYRQPIALGREDVLPGNRTESPDNLSAEEDMAGGAGGSGGRRCRKNYKNMTRERRVEANARERTRVHTISAAFEALRRAVPSYSYNQKLSKLAILKIACTYIMALARLADVDCSEVSELTVPVNFADCVDLCTRTIQTEGRARRRH